MTLMKNFLLEGSRKLAKEVLRLIQVVDGVVNLTGLVTLGSGEGLKYFETGRAQFYALIVLEVYLLVAIFGFNLLKFLNYNCVSSLSIGVKKYRKFLDFI